MTERRKMRKALGPYPFGSEFVRAGQLFLRDESLAGMHETTLWVKRGGAIARRVIGVGKNLKIEQREVGIDLKEEVIPIDVFIR